MYKINNNYYVKVGSNYVEVELEYGDNDITLKPTKNKIRVSNDIHYEEFDFPSVKQSLLQEHNKHSNYEEVAVEENEDAKDEQEVNQNKRFSTRRYTR